MVPGLVRTLVHYEQTVWMIPGLVLTAFTFRERYNSLRVLRETTSAHHLAHHLLRLLLLLGSS